MSQESNEILEMVKKLENTKKGTKYHEELKQTLINKIKEKMDKEYNKRVNVLPKTQWPPHHASEKNKMKDKKKRGKKSTKKRGKKSTKKRRKKSTNKRGKKRSNKYKGGYCYFNCKKPNKNKMKKKNKKKNKMGNITKKSKKYSKHSKTSKNKK